MYIYIYIYIYVYIFLSLSFFFLATRRSEELAESYGSTDWILLHKHRKWKLAEKVAIHADNRWAQRLLQ